MKVERSAIVPGAPVVTEISCVLDFYRAVIEDFSICTDCSVVPEFALRQRLLDFCQCGFLLSGCPKRREPLWYPALLFMVTSCGSLRFLFGDQRCTTLDVFFCCAACLGHARISRPVNTRLRRRGVTSRCFRQSSLVKKYLLLRSLKYLDFCKKNVIYYVVMDFCVIFCLRVAHYTYNFKVQGLKSI